MKSIDKQKKVSKFRKGVQRAVIAAGVYHVWFMRNAKLWGNRVETIEYIVQIVKKEIAYRVKHVMPKKVKVRDREWFESICRQ